jgi:hypothetical protein
MNENVLPQLKVIVERAVRPVKASFEWKKKTREELLAHVTEVFQDELSRGRSEREAVQQAATRFGDPGELTRSLQNSVSFPNRVAYCLDRMCEPRPDESLVRRAARYASLTFGFMVFSLLPLFFIGRQFTANLRLPGMGLTVPLLLSAHFGVILFVSTLLEHGFERTLFGGSKQSIGKALLLALLSAAAPLLLHALFVATTSCAVSDDSSVIQLPNAWGILAAVIGFPAILIAVANHFAAEKRYAHEWSTLQID